MEKNGNTFAPGDKVRVTGSSAATAKVASGEVGVVDTINPDTGVALIKWAFHEAAVAVQDLQKA